ncbi:MAG: hypothetical protein IT320_16585 [Anaerolineae bacterium]|nr:hypothetical protein [Anaerolineae bacterium]
MQTDRRAQRFAHYKSAARGLARRALIWMIFCLIVIGLGLAQVFGAGGLSLTFSYVAAAGWVAGAITCGWALWRQRDGTIDRLLDREDARAAEARSRFY